MASDTNQDIYEKAIKLYNSENKDKSIVLFITLAENGHLGAKFYCYLNGWKYNEDLRRAALYNIERLNSSIKTY